VVVSVDTPIATQCTISDKLLTAMRLSLRQGLQALLAQRPSSAYRQEHRQTYTENKFTDFLFHLTSVNLLLNSVLRPSIAEAHFAASVAKHSDKLEKCVQSPHCSRSTHTWSLLSNDMMWSNRLRTKLYLPSFLGGSTKTFGELHAARGPRVKDPWPTMFIGTEMSVNKR
jgi:hypothetical protein